MRTNALVAASLFCFVLLPACADDDDGGGASTETDSGSQTGTGSDM